MNKIKIICVLLFAWIASGCETEFVPKDTNLEAEVVVEGFIEAAENPLPPYVLLTKSVPFFTEFDLTGVDNLFIHDAEVVVSDGSTDWTFTEVCLDDVPPALRPILADALGFDPDSLTLNICVYLETTFSLTGTIGSKYDLRIELADGKMLSGSTTIPDHVPIENLRFQKPADAGADSLLELRARIQDIPGRADFYRYFTGINAAPVSAPFQSVGDDAFFDGQEFEFIIPKAEDRLNPPPIEEFGLYHLGDTVEIKWTTIDEAHYTFWSTLEFNAISQGPFSSYTIVDSNINGGIGVWGGYAASSYVIKAE